MAKNPLELSQEIQGTQITPSAYEEWQSAVSSHPKKRGSISDWNKAYQGGAFNDPSTDKQISAGWYDWWGPDKSLVNGTKTVGDIISKLSKGGRIDLDKNYVWFKENQPVKGPRYLDFRFSDLDSGDVQYTTAINSPWEKKKYTVYGRDNEGNFVHDKPLFESDDVDALIQWYNSPISQIAPQTTIPNDDIEEWKKRAINWAAKYPDNAYVQNFAQIANDRNGVDHSDLIKELIELYGLKR